MKILRRNLTGVLKNDQKEGEEIILAIVIDSKPESKVKAIENHWTGSSPKINGEYGVPFQASEAKAPNEKKGKGKVLRRRRESNGWKAESFSRENLEDYLMKNLRWSCYWEEEAD